MSPINKAILDVNAKIPPQILQLVFSNKQRNWINTNSGFGFSGSVEAQIKDKIILGRVRHDINLNGGTEIDIDLTSIPFKFHQGVGYVYNIPTANTQGRPIIALRELLYNYDPGSRATAGYGLMNTTDSFVGAAHQIMNANKSFISNSSADLSIVGPNMILIGLDTPMPSSPWLRCVVGSDDNFTDLLPKAIPHFSKLVELATKAYIYNTFIVEIDTGVLLNGQQIGVLGQIVEGYADSNELYETYLKEKWQKIAIMNDTKGYDRIIKMKSGIVS